MSAEYDKSIVEYLPTIGNAKNIKTVSQGRNVSLTNGYIDETPLNIGIMKKRFNLRLTCKNIMEHPKASPKQKDWAKKIFDRNECLGYPELRFLMDFMKRYK